AAARRLQERLAGERRRGLLDDMLLTLEHPAVVTFGRHWQGTVGLGDSAASGHDGTIAHVRVDRGGGPTYHGPGQQVACPVVAVRASGRGVRAVVAALERSLCDVAARFGVAATIWHEHPGAWVRREGAPLQIGSVGLAVRRAITLHGAALNVERRAEDGF